jgi:hypothetical protein
MIKCLFCGREVPPPIFKNTFNLKTEIKKRIELLREIASKLANFDLINDFLLILRTNLVNSSLNSP